MSYTREIALQHAVAIATNSGDALHSAKEVVDAAATFEAFLTGAVTSPVNVAEKLEPAEAEPAKAAKAPEGYASDTLSCADCSQLDKDLKTAGFPGLVTPLSEITELSAGAVAALGALGFEYFGQVVDIGPEILNLFEEEEHAKQMHELLKPVGEFLLQRHQDAKDGSQYSEYGSLPLDSFSDLSPNTITILHNAGFQKIGDISHSLTASLRLLQLLPDQSQGMAVLGHVVTNLKHDVDESDEISEAKRARLNKTIERLQGLVAFGKDITSESPTVLTKDSEKLLELLRSSVHMGGRRFAVNVADPAVAAMLKDLVGDGVQLGCADITLSKEDGGKLIVSGLGMGLNPGNQTKH